MLKLARHVSALSICESPRLHTTSGEFILSPRSICLVAPLGEFEEEKKSNYSKNIFLYYFILFFFWKKILKNFRFSYFFFFFFCRMFTSCRNTWGISSSRCTSTELSRPGAFLNFPQPSSTFKKYFGYAIYK